MQYNLSLLAVPHHHDLFLSMRATLHRALRGRHVISGLAVQVFPKASDNSLLSFYLSPSRHQQCCLATLPHEPLGVASSRSLLPTSFSLSLSPLWGVFHPFSFASSPHMELEPPRPPDASVRKNSVAFSS